MSLTKTKHVYPVDPLLIREKDHGRACKKSLALLVLPAQSAIYACVHSETELKGRPRRTLTSRRGPSVNNTLVRKSPEEAFCLLFARGREVEYVIFLIPGDK